MERETLDLAAYGMIEDVLRYVANGDIDPTAANLVLNMISKHFNIMMDREFCHTLVEANAEIDNAPKPDVVWLFRLTRESDNVSATITLLNSDVTIKIGKAQKKVSHYDVRFQAVAKVEQSLNALLKAGFELIS